MSKTKTQTREEYVAQLMRAADRSRLTAKKAKQTMDDADAAFRMARAEWRDAQALAVKAAQLEHYELNK